MRHSVLKHGLNSVHDVRSHDDGTVNGVADVDKHCSYDGDDDLESFKFLFQEDVEGYIKTLSSESFVLHLINIRHEL